LSETALEKIITGTLITTVRRIAPVPPVLATKEWMVLAYSWAGGEFLAAS
jgi:hypothetical protein